MGLLMEILDAAGRAIAKPNADEAEVDVLQEGDDSSEALVNWSEGGKKRSATGNVANTTLAQMTLQTVNIPQNFAGLESVSTPTRLRYQLFTITSVDEQDDYVEVVASHIFYEQATNYTVWTPETLVNYSCGAICRNVMNNTINGDEGFRVATDCTEELPWHQIDYARKNLVEVFLDPEKGICNRFNLNIVRDNMNFYVLKNVGYDRGFVIEDKKNLLGVQRQESIDNTITRIAAYGKDKDGNIVWLNNNGKKYVDSQYVSNYKHPRVEIYDTGIQITGDKEAELLHEQGRDSEIVTANNINAKIYNAAVKRFTEDHVDDPEVTMKVDFVSLGDTEEYKQYRDLDKVYLYDIIHVKHSGRDYSYGAQVIGVEHDILTGMLLSVTIGNIVNWDGIRKVAGWQVPEIDGSVIRMHTITSSQYANDSITSEAIKDNAITGDKVNVQSVSHKLNIDDLKSILAQAGLVLGDDGILIYQTSDDNMFQSKLNVQANRISLEVTNRQNADNTLSGQLTVEANKVAMIVGTYEGQNFIKAAEISTAINNAGEGIATINATKVNISATNTVHTLAGEVEVDDQGHLTIKSAGGMRVRRTEQGITSEFGVFDDGNLDAGVIVRKVNGDSTAYINANHVNISATNTAHLLVNAIEQDDNGNLIIKATGGARVRRTEQGVTAEYGLYDGGNLTAGIVVEKINGDGDTTATHIKGNKIYVGNGASENEQLSTWAADTDGLFATSISALQGQISSLNVDKLSTNQLSSEISNLASVRVSIIAGSGASFTTGSFGEVGTDTLTVPNGGLTLGSTALSTTNLVKSVEGSPVPGGGYKLTITQVNDYSHEITFNTASSLTFGGAWTGASFTATATDGDGIIVGSASTTISYGWNNGSLEITSESDDLLLSIGFDYDSGTGAGTGGTVTTINTFDSSHLAYARVLSDPNDRVYHRFRIDATSVWNSVRPTLMTLSNRSSWTYNNKIYNIPLTVTCNNGQTNDNFTAVITATEAFEDGEDSVTLTSGWEGATFTVTASNGGTRSTTIATGSGENGWVLSNDRLYHNVYADGAARLSDSYDLSDYKETQYNAGWYGYYHSGTWQAPSSGNAGACVIPTDTPGSTETWFTIGITGSWSGATYTASAIRTGGATATIASRSITLVTGTGQNGWLISNDRIYHHVYADGTARFSDDYDLSTYKETQYNAGWYDYYHAGSDYWKPPSSGNGGVCTVPADTPDGGTYDWFTIGISGSWSGATYTASAIRTGGTSVTIASRSFTLTTGSGQNGWVLTNDRLFHNVYADGSPRFSDDYDLTDYKEAQNNAGWAAYWGSSQWGRPTASTEATATVKIPGQTPTTGQVAWFIISSGATIEYNSTSHKYVAKGQAKIGSTVIAQQATGVESGTEAWDAVGLSSVTVSNIVRTGNTYTVYVNVGLNNGKSYSGYSAGTYTPS